MNKATAEDRSQVQTSVYMLYIWSTCSKQGSSDNKMCWSVISHITLHIPQNGPWRPACIALGKHWPGQATNTTCSRWTLWWETWPWLEITAENGKVCTPLVWFHLWEESAVDSLPVSSPALLQHSSCPMLMFSSWRMWLVIIFWEFGMRKPLGLLHLPIKYKVPHSWYVLLWNHPHPSLVLKQLSKLFMHRLPILQHS